MLYNLIFHSSSEFTHNGDNCIYSAIIIIFCFVFSIAALKIFKGWLPKDQGRAFALNGELSEGKPRGAGLIFISSFLLCMAIFVPLSWEHFIYLACIYGAMITGYLDDAAEKPWGNLKKGLLDLVIAVTGSFTYYYYNGSDIHLIGENSKAIHVPAAIFIILAIILVWASINVTNCCDGVDGLCCSLVMSTIICLYFIIDDYIVNYSLIIMFTILGGYLWYNCSPSRLLMGDAGSRALGVFLAIMFLKSGYPLLFIPMAIVIILDGGLGLIKLSFRRFLKMKNFMEKIRTPLHDHMRKNKGWSDTQVVTRFTIIQLVIGTFFVALSNSF